jgi:ferritin-like protein
MEHPTRRALLRTGIVGTVAAAAGGALLRDPVGAAADILGDARGDAALLERIVAIEQLIAFAYDHVIANIQLSPAAAKAVRTFASQEHEHVRLLSSALRDRGHTPPPPPTSAASVSRQLTALHGSGSLTSFRRQVGAIEYLIGIETVAEGVYYSAISRLSDRNLVELASGILGCEAQHWTILEQFLHPGDVLQIDPYSTVHG